MSRFAEVCRVFVGIVSGLVCGQAANRCLTPPTPTDSPLEISEQHDSDDEIAEIIIADSLALLPPAPLPLPPAKTPENSTPFSPPISDATTSFVSWTTPLIAPPSLPSDVPSESTPKGSRNALGSNGSNGSLSNEVEKAVEEMRELDRLQLPERREVALRLYSRLCQINEQLRNEERGTQFVPNEAVHSKWDGRPDELTNNRALVRSLLAAIAVAPEKSAFVSKASQQRCEAEDPRQPTDLVVVGDVQSIKKTDSAWFFQVTDPYRPSQEHMVRFDCYRLEQRIPIGSRIVALGRTDPTESTENETQQTSEPPIVATEIYAITR